VTGMTRCVLNCACCLYCCVQVVQAAFFDLLFSQCDRHGRNLCLLPTGISINLQTCMLFK
jgi:hypothetical protein